MPTCIVRLASPDSVPFEIRAELIDTAEWVLHDLGHTERRVVAPGLAVEVVLPEDFDIHQLSGHVLERTGIPADFQMEVLPSFINEHAPIQPTSQAGGAPSSSLPKTYTCKFCGDPFASSTAKKNHQTRVCPLNPKVESEREKRAEASRRSGRKCYQNNKPARQAAAREYQRVNRENQLAVRRWIEQGGQGPPPSLRGLTAFTRQ